MSAAEQARREEVFAALFDRFWAPVRHHIEWLVHDDAEVTEIVSEVFLQAWSRLDPEKPMDRVWLLRGRPHPALSVVLALVRALVAGGDQAGRARRRARGARAARVRRAGGR